jgi:hypothetical protein
MSYHFHNYDQNLRSKCLHALRYCEWHIFWKFHLTKFQSVQEWELYCQNAGAWLQTGFIVEWLYWPFIHTTQNYNYSATANLHTLQITTAPAQPFPACCVFNSHSLATASNSGDSSTSCGQVLSSQPSLKNSSGLIAPTVMVITSQNEPHRKQCSSIVAFVSTAAGTCLLSRCPETAAEQTTENTVLLWFRVCMLRPYLAMATA